MLTSSPQDSQFLVLQAGAEGGKFSLCGWLQRRALVGSECTGKENIPGNSIRTLIQYIFGGGKMVFMSMGRWSGSLMKGLCGLG